MQYGETYCGLWLASDGVLMDFAKSVIELLIFLFCEVSQLIVCFHFISLFLQLIN